MEFGAAAAAAAAASSSSKVFNRTHHLSLLSTRPQVKNPASSSILPRMPFLASRRCRFLLETCPANPPSKTPPPASPHLR